MDVAPIHGGCTQHHVRWTHPIWICLRLDSTTYSRCLFPLTAEVDVMSISWMYAFPPFLMLARVIGLDELHRDHPCENDPDRPEMDQSVLVFQTDRAAGRFSFGPVAQERSHDPAPQPPETSVATSSCAYTLGDCSAIPPSEGIFTREAPITSSCLRQYVEDLLCVL